MEIVGPEVDPVEADVALEPIVNDRPELMNCDDYILSFIMECIKTHNSDEFFALRELGKRWYHEYSRIAKQKDIRTLSLMPNFVKPNYEELKARFYDCVDLSNAINIRPMPNIAKPNDQALENYYSSVTQLFLGEKYFSLTNFWADQITHLSLYEDKPFPNFDFASKLNEMTSLVRLDLNGYFFVDYLKLKPTLERLEQLSVNFYMRSFRVYAKAAKDLNEPHFAQLASCLTSKCTRFWFTQHEEKCSFAYWDEVNPRWISALTHFRINLFENDNYYASNKEEYRRCTISRDILDRFLDGQAPGLKALHLVYSCIYLEPPLVEEIAQITKLENLTIGVYYDHHALVRAWKGETLQSWVNVHTLDITYKYINMFRIPSDDFMGVLSTLVPNVRHLRICVIKSIYDVSPVYCTSLIRYFPQSFPQLLSYKFSFDDELIYEGKRNRPGEPFVTKMADDDDEYRGIDWDNDRGRIRFIFHETDEMRKKRKRQMEVQKRKDRIKRELDRLTKNTRSVGRSRR